MSTLLSSLVDNLSEKLHTDKCKDCKSVLDYMSVKDNQLMFQCLERKKNYKKDFNKESIKRFTNIFEFGYRDINKFILLLKKGFILMNTWRTGKDLMKHHYQIKKLLQQIKFRRYY